MYISGGLGGSDFIKELCDALSKEYTNEHPNPAASSNKRDLVQLFTAVVIPKVCQSTLQKTTTYTIKQTPEFRSSLQKTVRFQLIKPTASNVGQPPLVLYDGEVDDPSFEPGRALWPMKDFYHEALGHMNKRTKDYQFMLKTVHAVAGKESHVAQRAFAWVIINRVRANQIDLGGGTYEGVCKTLTEFCTHSKIELIPSVIDQAWEAIDQWLPNVEKELSNPPYRKAWDPSRGSLGFLKDDPLKKVNANGMIVEIQLGNLKFYKSPVLLQNITYSRN